jgi:hypothetical protein
VAAPKRSDLVLLAREKPAEGRLRPKLARVCWSCWSPSSLDPDRPGKVGDHRGRRRTAGDRARAEPLPAWTILAQAATKGRCRGISLRGHRTSVQGDGREPGGFCPSLHYGYQELQSMSPRCAAPNERAITSIPGARDIRLNAVMMAIDCSTGRPVFALRRVRVPSSRRPAVEIVLGPDLGPTTDILLALAVSCFNMDSFFDSDRGGLSRFK